MLDKMLDSMIVNGSYNRAAWPTSLTKWAISFGAASGVVFHDLVNPCPTTSLTLSHVKKQGYRGGSVGGSFSCGRSGAIRDFKGMGGQTYVHINS